MKYHYQVSCSCSLNAVLCCFGIPFWFVVFFNLSLKKKILNPAFQLFHFELNSTRTRPLGNPDVIKNISCFVWPCLTVAVTLSNTAYLMFTIEHTAWLQGFGFVLHINALFWLRISLELVCCTYALTYLSYNPPFHPGKGADVCLGVYIPQRSISCASHPAPGSTRSIPLWLCCIQTACLTRLVGCQNTCKIWDEAPRGQSDESQQTPLPGLQPGPPRLRGAQT